MKNIYKNLQLFYIMVKGSWGTASTLRTKHGCSLSALPFSLFLEVRASAISQEKEIQGMHIGKEEIQISLLRDNRTVCRKSKGIHTRTHTHACMCTHT